METEHLQTFNGIKQESTKVFFDMCPYSSAMIAILVFETRGIYLTEEALAEDLFVGEHCCSAVEACCVTRCQLRCGLSAGCIVTVPLD